MSAVPVRRIVSENDLFRAYARTTRAERCVCGGWLVPEGDGSRAILEAQEAHNLTSTHQSWRAWREAPE